MLILQVTDADSGINREVDFILDPPSRNLFSLSSSGPLSTELSLSHALDRETIDSYFITIYATDRGSPPLTGQTNISISIMVSLLSQVTHNAISHKLHNTLLMSDEVKTDSILLATYVRMLQAKRLQKIYT